MVHNRIGAVALCLCLSACDSGGQDHGQHGGFVLAFSHPSPHSSYVRIVAGESGSALPELRQIETAAFSAYLRRHTGCVINQSYPVAVLGDDRMPAGYMVPVSCASD